MAAASPATAHEQRPPRVFLSYSHDSPQHADRVLTLARQLRRDGVDARIGLAEAEPLMERALKIDEKAVA